MNEGYQIVSETVILNERWKTIHSWDLKNPLWQKQYKECKKQCKSKNISHQEVIAWLKSFGAIINPDLFHIWTNYVALRASFKQYCLFKCKLSACKGVPDSPEKRQLIQVCKQNLIAIPIGVKRKIKYLQSKGKTIPKGQEYERL